MTTRKCPGCGEAYRKGKRRVILHFDGSIAAAFVCPACVGRSVSFVTPFPRAGLTVSGVELLQKVGDRLRSQLKAARLVRDEGITPDFNMGRIDALIGACELIQRAIAGIEP